MSASLAYAMGINHLCPFNNNHIGLLYIEFFSLEAFSHKLLSHSHAIGVGPSRHSSANVEQKKSLLQLCKSELMGSHAFRERRSVACGT